MDINKDQQVNTFLKGMNTDISDALIDTSQYRYAENIRVTTNDEHNTGEVRLIEGNALLHNFGSDKKIIYINSIRDYVVVIVANGTISWSVYVSPDKGENWTMIFGPCEDLIWNTLDTVSISGVIRYESTNNVKLYIADNTGKHVIMPFWIDNSHWPSTPPTTLDSITGYQNAFLDAPVAALSNNTGHLKPAKIQYVYRLYKLGGAATTLSPVGNVLPLYKSTTEGYNDKEITDKAAIITVRLHNIVGLDRIQLFRITYMYNGQMPTVHRIEDKVIDPAKESVTIEDYGDNKEQLGIDELLSLTQMQIKPKLLESKGDTLFAANIKYVQDDVDQLFKNYDTRAFSAGNYWKLPDGTEEDITFTLVGTNEQHGGTLNAPIEGSELCHRQFNGGPADYNPEYWKPLGETMQGVVSGVGGKGENISWRFETEDVAISNTGRSTTANRRFYKCDETYRFGAILYNDKGQSSSVKWICDIRIPPRKDTDYTFTGEGQCTIKMYKPVFWIKNWPEQCKAIQIVQCPRKMNDRRVITQGIVGFPFRMYDKDNKATNYICPSGLMTFQRMHATNSFQNANGLEVSAGDNGVLKRTADSATDVLQFASPEYVYQSDDIKNILNTYSNQVQLQHVAAFDIYSDSTSNITNSKLVYPKTQDTSNTTYGTGFGYLSKNYANEGYYLETDVTTTGYAWDEVGPTEYHWGFVNGAESILDPDNRDDQYIWSANRNVGGKKLMIVKFNQANDNASNPWTWGYLAFNHVIPKSVHFNSKAVPVYPTVKTISYPSVPAWNKFADGETIRFQDDVTAVGSDSYINWTYPLCLDAPTGSDSRIAKCLKDTGDADKSRDGRPGYLHPVGTGGKCILMKLNSAVTFTGQSYQGAYLYNEPMANGSMAPIHVVNIVKQCTPYGGYSKEAIQNSTFYGHGNMVTESDFTSNQTYPLTVEAKGGDSYISFFKYNAIYVAATKQATVYEVPIETDMDIDADYGAKYNSSTNLGYYIQDEAASLPSVSGGYSQDKPAYQYNTAYNQDPNIVTYSSIEKTDISNYDWDTRIHNSELKTNGESIDSWLTFKALNYLDVDSRHGEITDIKLFKDRLVFWQNNATGILSSNERTMLNDASGNQIILGNGGILQRSDYISTIYGMKKDQLVSTQSNTTLYWWDGNDKEILAYTENGILPIGSLKAIRNYLNQHDENAHPYMFYDTKNKELVASVVNNESVVYSEQIEAFSSIYKFMPVYGTLLADDVLTTNDTAIYKQNVDGDNSYLFGTDNPITPKIQYVINSQNMFPKVFDIQTFGGRFYGGDNLISRLNFDYKTPLKQHSECTGTALTNREYDFRLDIPRNNNDAYGGRMRGKTMQCELSSTSNSTDFSLQYIVTKYRMSWS